MGSSVASPAFTQYVAVEAKPAAESSKDPTAYTSLPESAITEAQEVASELLMPLGMGKVVGVPFVQYAALVTLDVPFDPLPATYTSLPETVIPPAP